MNSNDPVILRLPLNDSNIYLIYQTFNIANYIFFDEKFEDYQLKDEYPDKFEPKYYQAFRDKYVIIINDKKEISFTISEFKFFANIIYFIARCFRDDPDSKIKKLLNSNFGKLPEFDFDTYKKIYVNNVKNLLLEYKKHPEIIGIDDILDDVSNWSDDI